MSTSPTSSYRSVSRDHDTGFPESVAAKTTSWRHPEANTNPGATLSSEDLDPARSLQRTRKSFMRHKYRRTLSHGRITEELVIPQGKYGPAPVSSIDSAIDLHGPKSPLANEPFSRHSKDTDSIGRTDCSSINEETTPISPVSSNFGSKAESPRRRHFFAKFRRS